MSNCQNGGWRGRQGQKGGGKGGREGWKGGRGAGKGGRRGGKGGREGGKGGKVGRRWGREGRDIVKVRFIHWKPLYQELFYSHLLSGMYFYQISHWT